MVDLNLIEEQFLLNFELKAIRRCKKLIQKGMAIGKFIRFLCVNFEFRTTEEDDYPNHYSPIYPYRHNLKIEMVMKLKDKIISSLLLTSSNNYDCTLKILLRITIRASLDLSANRSSQKLSAWTLELKNQITIIIDI